MYNFRFLHILIIHLKPLFHQGLRLFSYASKYIGFPGIVGAERGMPVLEEDYLHKFASERFALASATERLFERKRVCANGG